MLCKPSSQATVPATPAPLSAAGCGPRLSRLQGLSASPEFRGRTPRPGPAEDWRRCFRPSRGHRPYRQPPPRARGLCVGRRVRARPFSFPPPVPRASRPSSPSAGPQQGPSDSDRGPLACGGPRGPRGRLPPSERAAGRLRSCFPAEGSSGEQSNPGASCISRPFA